MKVEIILRFELPQERTEDLNRRITKVYEAAMDAAVDIVGDCGVKLLGPVELRQG